MKKIFLTLSVALGSYFIGNAQTATPSTNTAEIAFDSLVIDYGTTAHNADGNREFKFKNTGNTPLLIKNCQGSCGCTVPTWPKDSIMPGATSSIKVKYDTNRAGAFEKTITVFSNAAHSTKILKIKGVVNADPASTPPATGGN